MKKSAIKTMPPYFEKYIQLAFFDKLAALLRNPDESFDELRKLYEKDDRLRVPVTVFNALLNRSEPL